MIFKIIYRIARLPILIIGLLLCIPFGFLAIFAAEDANDYEYGMKVYLKDVYKYWIK